MKQKKIIQKLALLTGTFSLALMAFACPMTVLPVQAASTVETTVQPRQHDIAYRFKIENGKLYKRLYDYTIMDWIGDWIYVCDYPG